MRLGDLDALKDKIPYLWSDPTDIGMLLDLIDNAPTVFSCNACKNMGNERECVDCHDYSNYVHYDERPQGEMIETKHRLNLLIGVLYSNQLISENDIEYIEDSIKELMKGGAK